jgi:hypothetical protein
VGACGRRTPRRSSAPAGCALRPVPGRPSLRSRRTACHSRKGSDGARLRRPHVLDMETYTLPVLTYALPEAAKDALLWRHSTMDLAAQRAGQLGLAGVSFRGARSEARNAPVTGPRARRHFTSTRTSPQPSAGISMRLGIQRSSKGPASSSS